MRVIASWLLLAVCSFSTSLAYAEQSADTATKLVKEKPAVMYTASILKDELVEVVGTGVNLEGLVTMTSF